MQDLVNHITAYLKYLQTACCQHITIHEFQTITAPCLAQFLPYRVHSNAYCVYLKSHPEIWDDCIDNQKKIIPLLENGPFWGTCHCGVTEYVYPIRQHAAEKKVIGFISVSGYRSGSETEAGKLRHICGKYDLNYETVHDLAGRHLCAVLPDPALLDTLLYPLSAMLTQLYQKVCLLYGEAPAQAQETCSVLNKILLYLEKNYRRQVSLEDICTAFHCSRSYISHSFKSRTGCSFREYVNLLRMEEARKLLADTSLSVTEISLKTGFASSNYFSLLFHKMNGMAPLEYRRRNGA